MTFLICVEAYKTEAFTPSILHHRSLSKGGKRSVAVKAEQDEHDKLGEPERKLFDEIAEKFLSNNQIEDEITNGDFPSAFPINPFKPSLGQTGGKATLYSDEELFNVLTLHENLAEELNDDDENPLENESTTQTDSLGLPGIHDLVLNALEKEGNNGGSMTSLPKEPFSPGGIGVEMSGIEIDQDIKDRITKIRAIASDVDGTILTSKKMIIHPRTRLAIMKAIRSSSDENAKIRYFFPATGKSRKGALDSLGIELGNLIGQNCAGVYLQGLFCVDTQGKVVFEQKLDRLAIDATEALVEESGISIVAYDGDNLYTTKQTDIVVHLHEHYGEPLPVLLPDDNGTESSIDTIRNLSTHEPSMHKLLLMDDDCDKLNNIVRPKLEALAEQYNATVTQALPTMLELLPKGCSKALGVKKLCDALGIDPGVELLALGDAENDEGMLEMASIGVAVGNASPPAREASDFIMDYTNDEGGAGYAMEWFALR